MRGDVLVAGDHAVSSAGLTMGLLRGSPTCPADAIAIGAGCVGAAGPLELDVDVLSSTGTRPAIDMSQPSCTQWCQLKSPKMYGMRPVSGPASE